MNTQPSLPSYIQKCTCIHTCVCVPICMYIYVYAAYLQFHLAKYCIHMPYAPVPTDCTTIKPASYLLFGKWDVHGRAMLRRWNRFASTPFSGNAEMVPAMPSCLSLLIIAYVSICVRHVTKWYMHLLIGSFNHTHTHTHQQQQQNQHQQEKSF